MNLEGKYKPEQLSEISFNNTASLLQNLNLETMPHMILHGRPGSGKRTLLYAFINHLFGKTPKTHHRTIEIETASKAKVSISFIESNEYVEICPSDYNFKDKDVMQVMIKNIAETRPIMSLISKKCPKLKLVIVTQAEQLSKDAQAALRRTVETYAKNFRIILVCSDMNRIIEPIKSRALCLSVESATEEKIVQELNEICQKEKLEVSEEIIQQIAKDSERNFRRALYFLDCYIQTQNTEKSKRIKSQASFCLEWEASVDDVIKKMATCKKIETIVEIRKILNELLVNCVPPKLILKRIFKSVMKLIDQKEIPLLSSFAAKYDGRLTLGSRSIFHLEAFVLAVVTHIKLK